MANNTAIINGTDYSWVDVSVNLLGRTVEGIKRIRYAHSQAKSNNTGRGKKPTGRGRGQETFEASMTLSKKEVAALQRALPPGRKLTDIKPFDIVIRFLNDENIPINETLVFCEFTGRSQDLDTASTEVVEELELIIGDIIYA